VRPRAPGVPTPSALAGDSRRCSTGTARAARPDRGAAARRSLELQDAGLIEPTWRRNRPRPDSGSPVRSRRCARRWRKIWYARGYSPRWRPT